MTDTAEIQEKGRWQVLSGSWLKVIAVTTMLLDHLAHFYWSRFPAFRQVLFTVAGKDITPYLLARIIGRLAFPLFAFLIVEGFLHTRNRKKYGLNLFVFALISEIPWNLVHSGTWLYPAQNVMFTLLLGYLGLCAVERYKDNWKYLLMSLLALLAVSYLLRAEPQRPRREWE